MGSILKVDINEIRENIKRYKHSLGQNNKFCAVVKADAYGVGSRRLCSEINDIVDYFAVALEKEFLEIKNYITKPVLILDPIYKNITKLAKRDLEFCVSNICQFEIFYKLAKRNKDVTYKIHLAINSGMNRFGFSNFDEVIKVFKRCQKAQNILIIGIFSHFYQGNNNIIAQMQISKLKSLKTILSLKFDISKINFHIANTDGFEVGKTFNMVRIGLGMFLKHNKNTISLISKIIEIQHIKTNDTVGYNLGFIAKKDMTVAVVSIGYADGIFRNIAGKGFVLINGKFAKILAVCMDSIIVDVTSIEMGLYDDVVLIGKSGNNQIFICDIASWCDTIEYEIMTRISKRVKRVFIGGNLDANHNGKIQSKKTCGG